MDVTPEQYDAATRRGKRLQAEYAATGAQFDRDSGMVRVSLVTKKELRFRPSAVRGMEHARPEQLEHVELGPAGVTLYFPDIDVDLSVPGLIHDADGKHIVIVQP